MSYTWDQIVAWFALAIPFAALAWSAVSWIRLEREKVAQRKFENLYDIILRIHNRDKSSISQCTAVFELRNYPEYKDFILDFCKNRQDFFDNKINERLDHEISRLQGFFEKKRS